MDRKKFLKKAALGTIATIAGSKIANAKDEMPSKSTYDKLMDQVGFNHLPADSNHENNNNYKMKKSVLHKANTRGHANHGWLNTHHSFSFANYYNPERMNFGVLRVLNDDVVASGRGFNTHPHDNMEIISIPLSGDLEHKDSMGNVAVIKEGDVQVMSAGTGIYHSEKNKNTDKEVRFLQIWMFPNQKNVTPRYDQITLENKDINNQLYQILSPSQEDEGVWVHQNAWFHMGQLEAGCEETYTIKRSGNGVYAFILEGDVKIDGQELNRRDGYGVWDADSITISASSNAKILLMDIPMSLS